MPYWAAANNKPWHTMAGLADTGPQGLTYFTLFICLQTRSLPTILHVFDAVIKMYSDNLAHARQFGFKLGTIAGPSNSESPRPPGSSFSVVIHAQRGWSNVNISITAFCNSRSEESPFGTREPDGLGLVSLKRPMGSFPVRFFFLAQSQSS